MRYKKIKLFVLLLVLFLPTICCVAYSINTADGNTPIIIHESKIAGVPRTNSIQATIDGHYLTVVFTENLGQVSIEIESTIYGEVSTQSTPTPNGVIIYISNTGSYTVTFTLPNGDVYYGEFEVTDN